MKPSEILYKMSLCTIVNFLVSHCQLVLFDIILFIFCLSNFIQPSIEITNNKATQEAKYNIIIIIIIIIYIRVSLKETHASAIRLTLINTSQEGTARTKVNK